MLLDIVTSSKTLTVLIVTILTPVLSDIVNQVLAAQPILKLVSQAILWCLSASFIFLRALNQWKEYQIKKKQYDNTDSGTP